MYIFLFTYFNSIEIFSTIQNMIPADSVWIHNIFYKVIKSVLLLGSFAFVYACTVLHCWIDMFQIKFMASTCSNKLCRKQILTGVFKLRMTFTTKCLRMNLFSLTMNIRILKKLQCFPVFIFISAFLNS